LRGETAALTLAVTSFENPSLGVSRKGRGTTPSAWWKGSSFKRGGNIIGMKTFVTQAEATVAVNGENR